MIPTFDYLDEIHICRDHTSDSQISLCGILVKRMKIRFMFHFEVYKEQTRMCRECKSMKDMLDR